MSQGRGGLKTSLSLSKTHMTSPASPFARGKKKREMADHLPRITYGPPIWLAAYVFSRLFCRDLHRRIHGHKSAALVAGLKRNMTVAEREKGMVLAHADAF